MDAIDVPLPDAAQLPAIMRVVQHWILWKAEARPGGKIAKVPVDRAGLNASFNDGHTTLDDALASAERLRRQHGNCYGVGLAFSEHMGIVGLDLDAAVVDGVRADHLNWFLDAYPTWSEFSISGTGAHLFFAGDFERKRSGDADGARFEIFGTVGFLAITGRVIPGSQMELAPWGKCGEFLTPLLVKKQTLPPARPRADRLTDTDYEAWGRAGLEIQCNELRQAAPGNIHHTMIRCATSVGRMVPHAVSFSDALESLTAAALEAGHEHEAKVRKYVACQLDFGGTDPSYPRERERADSSGVSLDKFRHYNVSDTDEPRLSKAPGVTDPGPFPVALLDVPGFVNDVMAWTNHNSHVLQPILALGGALSLLSVLTGRKVRDSRGIRTNLFVLSVARTGEGKDMARKSNKRLLFAAGADRMLGAESWASGPGLLAAVAAQPAVLFQNDEIGRFLETTGNASKAPHLFSIISNLLKLYTSAEDVFVGDAYADTSKQTSINQPHAVLYGTTAPGSLYRALSEDSITNGLMGRLLVFEAPTQQQPTQENDPLDPPAELLAVVKRWASWEPGGNLSGTNPQPVTVPSCPEAEAAFKELRQFGRDQCALLGDVLGSLWVRAAENARKLALLYACSSGFGPEARVTREAAEWACTLTQYLVRRQCWAASRFVSRNQTESVSLEVERRIEDSGTDGVTIKELIAVMRQVKERDLREIIASLKAADLVEDGKRPGKRRPFNVLIHSRNVDKDRDESGGEFEAGE